eukprot:15459549-Alexandrium_andersonii.AAC.2
MVCKKSGFVFVGKQLDEPLTCARHKFPQLPWSEYSQPPTLDFFDQWQVAKSYVGGSQRDLHQNSHSFTLVLRERFAVRLRKTCDDTIEFFNDVGMWVTGKSFKDLDDLIAVDCQLIWTNNRPRQPGDPPRKVPAPFNDDAWHAARREAVLRNVIPAE